MLRLIASLSRVDVVAGDARRPARRRQQSDQHPDRRRLSRAVRAEEAENLAGADVERDVVDGGEVAERAREIRAPRSRVVMRSRGGRGLRSRPSCAMKLSSTVGGQSARPTHRRSPVRREECRQRRWRSRPAGRPARLSV